MSRLDDIARKGAERLRANQVGPLPLTPESVILDALHDCASAYEKTLREAMATVEGLRDEYTNVVTNQDIDERVAEWRRFIREWVDD